VGFPTNKIENKILKSKALIKGHYTAFLRGEEVNIAY
jgi:hypothetical protein